MDRLARQGHRAQELLGVGPEGAAGGGERGAAAPALEEGHAEGVLERLDPRADGGLRDPERVRGPAKAAERADRQEGLDLRNLHADQYLLSLS